MLSLGVVAATVELGWERLSVTTLRPDAPIGEPRMLADLLPPAVWGSNLRAVLTDTAWRRLSHETSDAAGKRCEICGRRSNGPGGKEQRPDCHEVWRFERVDGRPVQRLERLIGLCKGCHNVQHIGLAESLGFRRDVIGRLCEVNGWTVEIAELDLARAWARHDLMGQLRCDLDLRAIATRARLRGWPSHYVPAEDRERLGNSWRNPAAQSPLFGEADS